MQRELKVEVRRHLSQDDVKYDGERQICDARVGIDHDVVVAEVEGVTENQGCEQEYRRHRYAVEVEVLERDPERVLYGPLVREQRQAEHRRGRHDRPQLAPSRRSSSLQKKRPAAPRASLRGTLTPQCAQATIGSTRGGAEGWRGFPGRPGHTEEMC